MSTDIDHSRSYYFTFVALLVLLALTVVAAMRDLGFWHFPVAISIAVAKAALIAAFFMHVRHSAALIKLAVAAALLWLGILFSLSLADYVSRGWL
jgi:cytochrome c oxidase subunit 4